ncbi:MAG: hypothetical protein HGA70_09135, partial [Chlorobiaceae bacterium]|nr:hypothetical protein [Chlorobiaceae bacterium]
MHRNYFTLYHAARELHEKLAGSRIDAVCTAQKGQAALLFTLAYGTRMQLIIAPGSNRLGMIAKDGPRSAGRNSAPLMQECLGKTVSGVSMSPFDRELTLNLENDDRLVLQFFGPKSNFLLVRDNIIIDAFRMKGSFEGRNYQEPTGGEGILRSLEKLALDKSLFLERFESEKKTETLETISAVLHGFDQSLARKLLLRAGSNASPEEIYGMFRTFFYEMLDPVVSVTEKDTGEPALSILSGAPEQSGTFDSVLEGLSVYTISMLAYLRTRDELRTFRSQLRLRLGKKKKELAAHDPGMLEKLSREYETCGHLLMASLGNEAKGRKSIRVINFFEPDSPVKTIDLKEALTLRENAEAYFAKAAKTKTRLAVMKERHKLQESETADLEKVIEAMDRIANPKDARRFLNEHGAEVQNAGKKAAAAPFRSVCISPKATLLIGKNAENNDRLTFGHARPDDIWLHARG